MKEEALCTRSVKYLFMFSLNHKLSCISLLTFIILSKSNNKDDIWLTETKCLLYALVIKANMFPWQVCRDRILQTEVILRKTLNSCPAIQGLNLNIYGIMPLAQQIHEHFKYPCLRSYKWYFILK